MAFFAIDGFKYLLTQNPYKKNVVDFRSISNTFYHFFEKFEKLLKIIKNFQQNKFGHFFCRFGDIRLLSSQKGQKVQP